MIKWQIFHGRCYTSRILWLKTVYQVMETSMDTDSLNNKVPFAPGDWVIDKNNPGQPGQYTGNCRNAGPHIMVQLSFPGGNFTYRPLTCLEAMPPTFTETIEERLRAGHFGKLRDLQRLITYERQKGTCELLF